MDNFSTLQTTDKVIYLAENGWHFNKKACEYAVKGLKKKNPASGKLEPIEPWTKDQVEELLAKNNITLTKLQGYDHVYVANMAKSDFFHSSLPDEQKIALYVKDVIDDGDAEEGEVMACWYVKALMRGVQVDWGSYL